jgi:hypothetical protein
MSIDVQLAVEQMHSCRHRPFVFEKRLQYKCTICCRPQLRHCSDKLHVVLKELLPLQYLRALRSMQIVRFLCWTL